MDGLNQIQIQDKKRIVKYVCFFFFERQKNFIAKIQRGAGKETKPTNKETKTNNNSTPEHYEDLS